MQSLVVVLSTWWVFAASGTLFVIIFFWTCNMPVRASVTNHTSPQTAISPTQVLVLYDGQIGGTPDTQGFVYVTSPAATATQIFTSGVTILDTTQRMLDKAGYFRKPAPAISLDRAAGYSIDFRIQISTEVHASND